MEIYHFAYCVTKQLKFTALTVYFSGSSVPRHGVRVSQYLFPTLAACPPVHAFAVSARYGLRGCNRP